MSEDHMMEVHLLVTEGEAVRLTDYLAKSGESDLACIALQVARHIREDETIRPQRRVGRPLHALR